MLRVLSRLRLARVARRDRRNRHDQREGWLVGRSPGCDPPAISGPRASCRAWSSPKAPGNSRRAGLIFSGTPDRNEQKRSVAASGSDDPVSVRHVVVAARTETGFGGSRSHSRVRPGDPAWPSEASWNQLSRNVGGQLVKVRSPLAACMDADEHGLRPGVQGLEEPLLPWRRDRADAVPRLGRRLDIEPKRVRGGGPDDGGYRRAVNFAREHNLRVVVKGGGHSYQGTSNAPDSLLIWTRKMNAVTVHDAFIGAGCAGRHEPQQAVTVEAGAIWGHVYDAVTTKAGRYVQGGGCLTVGVAGLIQSGGFGSFSKAYGMAAASLLEAEIVTADGAVRIANACTNPDLFWGLKGGGGGSLGVVTRLTLRMICRTSSAP